MVKYNNGKQHNNIGIYRGYGHELVHAIKICHEYREEYWLVNFTMEDFVYGVVHLEM